MFTDLVGSTRSWEEHPDRMQTAMARRDELLRNAVDAHDGYVVRMDETQACTDARTHIDEYLAAVGSDNT